MEQPEGGSAAAPAGPDAGEDAPPAFGSWGRIYAAVLVWLAVVMAAIALFQHWRF